MKGLDFAEGSLVKKELPFSGLLSRIIREMVFPKYRNEKHDGKDDPKLMELYPNF